jgi:hypothetical protein
MSQFGTFRTCWGELTMSAPEGRADSLFGLIEFMSTRLGQRRAMTMRNWMKAALSFALALFAGRASATEGATIAVFTKNTINPAYQAFRLAADQVGRAAGAKIVHFVPNKPDNVDEQIAMVD